MSENLKALLSTPIAHRGLWNSTITENTETAFIKAVEGGFSIETDLYMTLDGQIVCCHDNNLFRLAGKNKCLTNLTLKEIKDINLIGGGKVPTLTELLNVVNGKVFLLLEIKNQPNKLVVDKVVEILKSYNGKFAIQSFNPFHLARVKKLAPNFLRGILADNNPDTNKTLEKWVVKYMPFNFLCKPQFISYNYNGLPLKKCKRKNLPVIAWTITNKERAEKIKPMANNIIFENFIP